MIEKWQYTEIVVQYTIGMQTWCNEHIPGHGHVISPGCYFDDGCSWYARRVIGDNSRVIFSFARPEDAVLFTLRWS